jgi:hypothetical protein
MEIMKKLFLVIILVQFSLVQLQAQLNAWTKRVCIEVTENQGITMSDFPLRIVYDTETPILAGNMDINGDDIRFSSDSCGSLLLSYWIESGINTDSTVMYIKLDQLTANLTDSIFMFYGNSAASSVSDIDSVFQNYYISGGNDTILSGTVNYDYFKLSANDSLHLVSANALELQAKYCILNGIVNGNGKGYQSAGSAVYANGNGPGAGTIKSGDASSGAGYGGNGGDGGADSSPPAAGGLAYGTNDTDTIQMGSSGGSTDNGIGGNGGGAIAIRGIHAVLNGSILLNGDDNVFPTSSVGRGAGGGSGGGFLVNADDVIVNAAIEANGGDGGEGNSSANDGGGGGAGGRIKIFYSNTILNNGILSANGGAGGKGVLSAPGENGDNGTIYSTSSLIPTKYSIAMHTEIDNPGCPVADIIKYSPVEFAIYPNPTKGIFIITADKMLDEEYTIEIRDIQGKLVSIDVINKGTQYKQYNASFLEQGVYFIEISSTTYSSVLKLIVN